MIVFVKEIQGRHLFGMRTRSPFIGSRMESCWSKIYRREQIRVVVDIVVDVLIDPQTAVSRYAGFGSTNSAKKWKGPTNLDFVPSAGE
jgi:hypothetical protein